MYGAKLWVIVMGLPSRQTFYWRNCAGAYSYWETYVTEFDSQHHDESEKSEKSKLNLHFEGTKQAVKRRQRYFCTINKYNELCYKNMITWLRLCFTI